MPVSTEAEPRPQLKEGIALQRNLGPVMISNKVLAPNFLSRHGRPFSAESIYEITGVQRRYWYQNVGERPDPLEAEEHKRTNLSYIALETAKATLKKKGWSAEKLDMICVSSCIPTGHDLPKFIKEELRAVNSDPVTVYTGHTGPVYFLKEKGELRGRNLNLLLISVDRLIAIMESGDFHSSLFSEGSVGIAASIGKDANCDIEIVDASFEIRESDVIQLPIINELIPPGSLTLRMPNDTKYFKMDGPRVIPELEKGNLNLLLREIAGPPNRRGNHLIVPHPGSKKIVDFIEQKTNEQGIRSRVTRLTLADGNLASGGAIGELAEVVASGLIKQGDEATIVGVGPGLAYGAIRLRFNKTPIIS